MRLFAFILLAAAASAQVPPPPPPPPPPGLAAAAKPLPPGEGARLEGVVRDTNGQAIARAQVRITASPADGANTPPQILTATSNDDGTFVLDGIAPGRHTVTAQRQGYANAQYGSRRTGMPGIPIPFIRGETVKDIVIEMVEQGVIAGTITDTFGDPVPNAAITVMRKSYGPDGAVRLQPAGTQTANDIGEYRVANLAPGEYFLRVSERNAAANLLGGNAAQGAAESNIATFYPNSADEGGARSLRITPGAEVRGANVQMLRGRSYSISGKLVGPDGAPIGTLIFTAVPDNGDAPVDAAAVLMGGLQASRPDGSFALAGLSPGPYVLQNLSTSPTGPSVIRHPVTIIDQNITGLVVQTSAGVDVKGTVRVDGGDLSSLPALTVSVSSPGVLGGSRSGPVQKDGAFEVKGASPGNVSINILRLPENMYVKSVTLGDREVRGFAELSGNAAAEIVLSTKAAAIVGATKAPPGSVLMLAMDSAVEGMPGARRIGVVDRNGTFEFKGLAPGSYMLSVWEEADTGLIAVSAFAAKFPDKSLEIELAEGDQRALEAPYVTAEEYRVEEAKLQ